MISNELKIKVALKALTKNNVSLESVSFGLQATELIWGLLLW